MAARRPPREPIAAHLLRIERTFIDRIKKALREEDRRTPEKRTHEARRTLKRLRALIRLLSETGAGKEFKNRAKPLRDAGRALSSGRDFAVCLVRLDELESRIGTFNGSAEFRATMDAELRKAGGDSFTRASSCMEQYGGIKSVPGLDSLTPGHLSEALEALAAKETLWFSRARLQKGIPAHHEWRKRVKDCWAAGAILNRIFDAASKKRQTGLKKLGSLLGEINDLALLSKNLRKIETPIDPSARAEIRTRTQSLMKQAHRLRGALART